MIQIGSEQLMKFPEGDDCTDTDGGCLFLKEMKRERILLTQPKTLPRKKQRKNDH